MSKNISFHIEISVFCSLIQLKLKMAAKIENEADQLHIEAFLIQVSGSCAFWWDVVRAEQARKKALI